VSPGSGQRTVEAGDLATVTDFLHQTAAHTNTGRDNLATVTDPPGHQSTPTCDPVVRHEQQERQPGD
jgi:hypothetical protein